MPFDQPRRSRPDKPFTELVSEVAEELGTTPAIAENVCTELAGIDTSRAKVDHLVERSYKGVADKWGIAREKLEMLSKRLDGDFRPFRRSLANQGTILIHHVQDALLDRLNDPNQLASIKTGELAKVLDVMGRTVVLLQDGQQASININIGDVQKSTDVLAKAKEVLSKRLS